MRPQSLAALLLSLLCITEPAIAGLNPDSPTVLITGSNRGLGLEFARQYAALDWNVIATCRNPADAAELQKLAAQFEQVTVEQLDVTSDAQVAELAKRYADQPVDVLLNNAGIYGTVLRTGTICIGDSVMIEGSAMANTRL